MFLFVRILSSILFFSLSDFICLFDSTFPYLNYHVGTTSQKNLGQTFCFCFETQKPLFKPAFYVSNKTWTDQEIATKVKRQKVDKNIEENDVSHFVTII